MRRLFDEREHGVKRRREKNYWEKRTERFSDGAKAQSRAGTLRMHEHVTHVKVSKSKDEYVVAYSVAKWYVEELAKARSSL